MAAGVTTRLYDVSDLVALLVPSESKKAAWGSNVWVRRRAAATTRTRILDLVGISGAGDRT